MQQALAISGLINGIVSIFFSLTILLNNRKSLVNRTLFLLTTVTALWSLSYWRWLSIYDDATTALFWVRILSIFSTLIPIFYAHWIISLLGLARKKRLLLVVFYTITIFFLGFTFSDLFVAGVAPVLNFAFWPRAGAVYTVYIFTAYTFMFVYSLLLLLKHYFSTIDPNRKEQLRYVVWGSALGFIGGASNFLLWYDIPVPPLGNFLVILYVFIFTYAIVRYQLMSVKLILRSYLVYFFTSASIVIPAFIWQFIFYRYWPRYTMISYLIIFILALSISSKIKKYYFKLSNKYFFSSLYDVREVISNLNNSLRSSLEIDRILKAVAEILSRAFHSEKIGVINYSSGKNLWSVLYNSGFQFEDPKKISLSYEVLAGFLSDGNRPVVVSKIKEGPLQQFSAVVDFLEKLDVVVVVPITIKGKLTSLLLFGPKESGDSYNREDLKVLEAVGTEIAISMENALLYQRTKKFNIELKDKVNKATKKLQEQNEELQKVNRIKNEFISVTSHQLKTPLATTKLNLEIFGLKFQKQIPAEANTMVENLTNTNNQLIKLVEELLDIARIEDSRLKIDIEPLDIVAMVKQMVSEFKPLADKRSIKVVEDYEVIPPLNFDRNILSKGIANFVSNGIKYNREKKNLWVSVKSNAEGVLIAVKDEGIGVPEAEKPKIFQKFYQATNAAAASFESSTGLGLYITRTSIETLGGKVWFEAEENKGSTFFIQLPPKVKVQNQ